MPRLPASSGLLRAQEGELLVLRTNNSPEQAPEKVSTPSQPSPRGRAWSLRSESACCITFRLPSRRPFLFHNTLLCPALSHLPKVRHFPAFSTHLPKVRRWGTALRTPVAAFPSPTDLTHLPKVRHFPAFSTHLPKVRRCTTAARPPYSRISISNRPYTPSEGETLSRIFHSPSEGETLSRIFHSPSEGAHFTHSSGIAIFAARNIETFTTNQITTEDDYHRTGERLASAYRYAGEVSLTSLRRRSR